MIPNMNPRQMNKMMQRMGIRQEEIEASEVIIKGSGRNIIITNPQVSKVNMMGQETYQIIGNARIEEESTITDEDIKTVAEQAGVSEEKAKEALEETDGDLAEAILKLQS